MLALCCISYALAPHCQDPKKAQHTNSVSTLMKLLLRECPQVEDLNNQVEIQITKQKTGYREIVYGKFHEQKFRSIPEKSNN